MLCSKFEACLEDDYDGDDDDDDNDDDDGDGTTSVVM